VDVVVSAFLEETVLSVRHWTDRLFSFTTTRDAGFRFMNGQFVMIGLPVAGKPLLRAYSIASANHEDALEFFSIKVPDGPLTSRLQHLAVGDRIVVGRKSTGTLVQENLLPGRHLFLLGTGTGLAPFLSIVKDPEAYDRFERIVLVHGCREVADLAFQDRILRELPEHEFLGDYVRDKLLYYPTVTREPYRNRGRITDLLASGSLTDDLGIAPLAAEHDRVMICGSPQMLADTKALLEERGFAEGSGSRPGQYVVEKAFAER
jgi:ferredoxin/flavodoxin---NADP+ reductase